MTFRASSYPAATCEYATATATSAPTSDPPASPPTGCTGHPSFILTTAPSPRISRELGAGRQAPKADDATLGGREHLIASLLRGLRVTSVTISANVPSEALAYLPVCLFGKRTIVFVPSVRRPWEACFSSSASPACGHAKVLDCGRLTSPRPPARRTRPSAALRAEDACRGTSIASSPRTRRSARPHRTNCGSLRLTRGNVNKPSRGVSNA